MSATTADRIYQTLMQRVVTGELAAGEKLRQDHIAREYETSHVPVREALLRLEAKGLAQSVPHRGTRVTALDPTAIREVVEMRVALECLALTHAMAYMSAQQLEKAETIRIACDEAQDMIEWDQLDRAYHNAILEPCGMPRLLSAIDDLHISASRHVFAHFGTRWQPRPNGDHAALLFAIRENDTPKASSLLRQHLRQVP